VTTTTTTTTTSTSTTTITPIPEDSPCYKIIDIIDEMSVTKDNNHDAASVIVMWGLPGEKLASLFSEYDAVVAVCPAPVRSYRLIQDVPVHYQYNVPVTVHSKDKTGITGEFMQWKVERELARLLAASAHTGSVEMSLSSGRDYSRRVGGSTLWITSYTVSYQT
jgi:hypothetical protein